MTATRRLAATLAADIADVDADAEFDGLVRSADIMLGHAALPFDRTTQPINDTGELHQQAISGRLYDPPAMLSDLRVN